MTQPDPAPPSRRPTAGGDGWTLFRIAGFPVQIGASWLILAGFVLLQVWGIYEARLSGAAVAVAAAATVILFALSILVHELGHAFASLAQGIAVRRVQLFGLGGFTESVRPAATPAAEFLIVAAGPAMSFVLWGAFLALARGGIGGPTGATVFGIVSAANLLLGIFNTVPAYPLDGGRLLRSILWLFTGDPRRSTRWAARVGQVLAVGFGIWMLQRGVLWNVFLAFFLFQGATAAYRGAAEPPAEQPPGRTVRELMGSAPPPLDPQLSPAAAATLMRERPSLLWPVGDPLTGGVTLPSVERGAEQGAATVSAVATPPERVTVGADELLDAALRRLIAAPDQMLLVVEDGRVVGLLTPSLVAGG